jgi:RNA polymerase subunit RPABC4/transcription elongation factor Spt4
VLYLILRPEKTLLEKYHEDLEYRMLEGGDDLCFSCATPVKEDFTFCYECGEKLKFNCSSCKKSISRRWKICPFCGEKQKVSNQTNTKKKKS